ncbi:P-loop containing nucleoside triphosphate hydrolase [Vibrio phage 2.275.O._10N.286.54.E11]|nr:P-loop containing nucleoside triphosphate hydrolase [Vibrio phage 2.275.O._10N.286.54.E11]
MTIPKVIGLTGVISSGKDTVATMLMEEHNYKQASFAEPVKDVLAAIFGWDRDLLEGKTNESRQWRTEVDEYWSDVLGYDFTPRLAMQQIGTDIFRDHFHQNIWVKSIQKRVQTTYPNDLIIFSDCRFQNEIDMVRDMGGCIIEVQPSILPEWYNEAAYMNQHPGLVYSGHHQKFRNKYKDVHESEFSWVGVNNPDATIINNGTLDDLQNKVQGLFQ